MRRENKGDRSVLDRGLMTKIMSIP
jgi:hypothetical protein